MALMTSTDLAENDIQRQAETLTVRGRWDRLYQALMPDAIPNASATERSQGSPHIMR